MSLKPTVAINKPTNKTNKNNKVRIISYNEKYEVPFCKCGLEVTPPMPKYMREKLEKEKKENNND